MRKAFTIILMALLVLSLFISCEDDSILDDAFGNMVTLTYNGNGSTSGKTAPERIVKEAPLTIKDNGFKRTDYHFLGWNTAADGTGTVYEVGATVNLTENVTLYAQWAHDEATVRYLANTGTGTMADQIVYTNTDFALKPNDFTKEDYIFIGWNTSADGTGDGFLDGATTSISSDITLYAQWLEGVIITSETTAMTTGKYNLISDVTIASRVTVTGSATINLLAGNTLTVRKGINVSGDNSLTIEGSGNLTIKGTDVLEGPDDNCAGIGGNDGQNAGTINIKGGNLEVYGGNYAAGIGGGRKGAGGHITITGGTVEARGVNSGAGIGSGYNESEDPAVNGGIIIISGGAVTASGGSSAGIGGGYLANCGEITISGTANIYARAHGGAAIGSGGKYLLCKENNGVITITGGTIDANGDGGAAGIGGGASGDGGTINISGGTVTASGVGNYSTSSGAGIGGGSQGNGGTINISGGHVTATAEDGACIGSGKDASGGNITISDGTVEIITRAHGAGIGSGFDKDDYGTNGGNITIEGGTVLVNADPSKPHGDGGAGIGGGQDSAGGSITITGGTVEVHSWGNGAGIGGGYNNTGAADEVDGGTITISGGTVSAYGGAGAAGIGGGQNGDSGSISIGSEAVIVLPEGGDGAVGIGHGFQGNDEPLSLDLGADLLVSANGTDWTDYVTDPEENRKKYMKTK